MLTRREVLAALGVVIGSERMRLFAKQPAQPAAVPTVFHIAADDDGLYGVSRAALGAPSVLWHRPHGRPLPVELARDAAPIFGITPRGAHVHFLAGERVLRVPKTGGSPEVMARAPHPATFLTADRTHLYVAVGDTRRAYQGGAPPTHPGSVSRLPLEGGPLVQLVEHRSWAPRLTLDEDRVYLATDDGIASVAKHGGPLQPLVATGDQNDHPTALVSAGGAVYATVRGELRRIDTHGGGARVLYRASILLDLAVKDGWLYVVRNTAFLGPGRPPEPGAVVACALATGAVRTVAEPLQLPQSLAIGGPTVFVLELASGGTEPGLTQVREVAALPPA